MSTRVRVTVTLPPDLVSRVDDEARRSASASRSSVVERWLRSGSRRQSEHALETATIAYYAALTEDDRAEDAALSAALTSRARSIDVDGTTTSRPTRAPRRR